MALTKLSTDVIDLSGNTTALTIPSGVSVSTTATTTNCSYPSSIANTALYQMEANADNSSTCATSGSYNGTQRGMTYTTGKFGNAATFGGGTDSNASTGSQIYIDNSVWGGNTSTFSVSLWFKGSTTPGETPLIGNGGTIGSTIGFAIYTTSDGKLNGTLCSTGSGGTQVFFGNTTDISDDQWHHIAFTFDNSSSGAYVLYLDNQSHDSGTTGAFTGNPTPTYDTYIGNRWNRNENGVLNGQIDQVRIFANTILTAAQVTELYNETNVTNTSGRPTSPAEGLLRDNTTTGALEFYDGSIWQQIAGTLVPDYQPPTATGNFITTLFNGNNTTVTTGFQADLAWVSNRQYANGNFIYDSVRGASNNLWPTGNYAEGVRSGVTAFNATSTTIGTYASIGSGGSGTNVQWAWKAGGTAVTNTDGTISSQVSLNQNTGFSIATYTGNGTQNATVGNGLNSQANLVIIKNRDQDDSWFVGSSLLSANNFLELDQTYAQTTNANLNYTINTSTMQFTSATPHHMFNASSENYVMYSWTSITGYSKIGIYSGTGSGSTQSINTGFEVGWVIIKDYTAGGSWFVQDNKRGSQNSITVNTGNAESTTNYVTFTSTGFDVTSGLNDNSVSSSFIYMAFRS